MCDETDKRDALIRDMLELYNMRPSSRDEVADYLDKRNGIKERIEALGIEVG